MANDSDPAGKRSPYGPQPLSALVPRLTRPAFRKRSPAGAQLLSDWPALVGPALAQVTMPRRFAGGRLTIGCAGPVAMELQYLAPQLIARINGQLGEALVRELRFVQQAGAGTPSPPLPPPPRPLPARVAAELDLLTDAGLRAALEKLGRGVYRRRP
jgi:hypothetical protein